MARGGRGAKLITPSVGACAQNTLLGTMYFQEGPVERPYTRGMAQPALEERLTVDEYLEFERDGQVRHEYAGGYLFAMSGAIDEHNRVAGNIFGLLWTRLRGTDCRVYANDMKAHTGDVFYYPDVIVTCDPEDTERYFKTRPCLVVEVLSPTTEAIDRGE